MTAAEAALEALDTASALPHETEALDRLLTAQAAVRRRQVSMQPNGGSGGRQAPLDLSQLFDRELRREQETSYETGRQPGEPEADGDDEALDRLRELARRQERLNRELRRSPETGTAEERRRRLERLRREQQALRAEAEALAERLGGRPGADGRSGSGGTPREDLRRAADEMRRAGGGLRREDAEAARGHGDRAADALRRLAERLRAGLGDEAGVAGGPRDEVEERLAAELEIARRLIERLQASAAGDRGSRNADGGQPLDEGPPRGEPSSSSRGGNEATPAGDRSGGAGSETEPRADPSEERGASVAGSETDAGREAAAELAQRPELLRALDEANPGLAADLDRWARQWRSRSAPGTDPARLDFAHWTLLRRDLVTALRRFESDRARDLAERALRDRYAAGPDDAVPERYRRLVDQYYRSLAGAPPAVP